LKYSLLPHLEKSKIVVDYKYWLLTHLKFANKVKLYLQQPLKMVKIEKRPRRVEEEEEYDLKPLDLTNIR